MAEKETSKNVAENSVPAAEIKTIEVMINLFCHDHHSSTPCDQCLELLEYTLGRVRQCPLGEQRKTCGQCHVHCFKPSMRKKIKDVMRYAGPRMLKTHSVLAARTRAEIAQQSRQQRRGQP